MPQFVVTEAGIRIRSAKWNLSNDWLRSASERTFRTPFLACSLRISSDVGETADGLFGRFDFMA